MIIIGIILIVGGLVLYFYVQKQVRDSLLQLESTMASNIPDVIDTRKQLNASLGSNSFSMAVKLRGRAECDSPLTSELSQTPCVYFRYEVHRRYKVQEQRRDKDGNITTVWVDRSDRVAGNERIVPFELVEGEDSITVNMEGAKKEATKVLDRFDPGQQPTMSLSVGGFSMPAMGSNMQVTGFHYQEFAISVGTHLYVVGNANDRDGTLRISQHTEKGQPFLVSVKSEEEIVRGKEQQAQMAQYGGIGLVVVGIGLILFQLFGAG